VIKVESLTKSFGNTIAVDNLSFEVKSGEVVGLLGPNGAGKTTTMRLITGYLFPDAGQVTVDNIPVTANPVAAQRKIGYLPEDNPLYEEMLVSELLDFSANLKAIPRNQRRRAFDFVVSAVGIGNVYHHLIGELSKGFKQRVGLALALLHQPTILIMDEPTEGLDPNQRAEIRTLIKKLARDHTVIMSTHVMQEASAVCNRLIIIDKGRLLADGTAEDLSHLAKGEKTIILDLEGRGIESALKQLKGVKQIDYEKLQPHRSRARISYPYSQEFRPEISRLIHRHQWTVWQLTEEKRGLEDIFHELTKKK
jgi:ABC-2 type transport system ATP-binding protein